MTAIATQRRDRAAARRRARVGLLAAVAGVTVACGAGNVRPRFAPFLEALTDTVTASPDSVILAAAAILEAEGIEVHHLRPREGFLETHWFNLNSGRRTGAGSLSTDDHTIIRVWADAISERQTVVVGEAARPLVVDPSLPPREREVPVTNDEPGYQVMAGVFAEVMALFGQVRTP